MRTFKSCGEFAAYLLSIAPLAEAAQAHGMRDAAVIVQEEAQRELGHYQPAVGPYREWAPLAESTLEGWDDSHGNHHPGKIELGYAPPDNPLLASGELKYSIEISYNSREAAIGVPDETVGDGSDGNRERNIGDVAVDLEFGTRDMPARSFLGRAAYVKREEIVAAMVLPVIYAIASVPYVRPQHGHAADSGIDDIPF